MGICKGGHTVIKKLIKIITWPVRAFAWTMIRFLLMGFDNWKILSGVKLMVNQGRLPESVYLDLKQEIEKIEDEAAKLEAK